MVSLIHGAIHFGFRKIESHIDNATGGRLFKVNGQPIFIRGGNWILSDGLLRLSKKRYKADIKFHADMNFNMIRCWGGGLAERPEFYDYCDIYGLLHAVQLSSHSLTCVNCEGQHHSGSWFRTLPYLRILMCYVWQEFWITGDCDGRGIPVSNPDGGNEQTPPHDINMALKYDLRLHPDFAKLDENGQSIEDLSPNLERSKPISGWLNLSITFSYRALLEGWTSGCEQIYWGLDLEDSKSLDRSQRTIYDHLHDQTAGFYGCRSAAEPIHVQLNLATYFYRGIEASVWDLEGTCPYYKVYDKLSVPPKKTVPIIEMKYPKSKNPKAVYFLLLKLYNMSNYGILSRNFYWLHLSGGDYKLLEPYRSKKIPLKITSKVFITGSTYEIQMHVQNTSKKPDSLSLIYKNNFIVRNGDGDYDTTAAEPVHSRMEEKHGVGVLQRICSRFSKEAAGLKVVQMNGADVGVAFFLHFSVHVSKKEHKAGEDTRILPVHYSDNYFSLVPGETMPITITFEVPPGVTPRVTLNGWNNHSDYTVY
ncbi:Mannosylglycoprotein endo-beta-mannosidase [Vitis vinifera]|uniref:Mannosylglycoprotein endo-beta-mannosidase n=1 Tax=Vitis vinifera TaxID=29760 RepID=A0A438F0J3_VITVI|nr:Mannosylglycoprotein endo-beta-mannosidase [Vitis vinifera]